MIGERGAHCLVGQRQRIAIARAIIRNHADPDSRRAHLRSRRWFRGRCHGSVGSPHEEQDVCGDCPHLRTIRARRCDLHDPGCCNCRAGSHDELLTANGPYAESSGSRRRRSEYENPSVTKLAQQTGTRTSRSSEEVQPFWPLWLSACPFKDSDNTRQIPVRRAEREGLASFRQRSGTTQGISPSLI